MKKLMRATEDAHRVLAKKKQRKKSAKEKKKAAKEKWERERPAREAFCAKVCFFLF